MQEVSSRSLEGPVVVLRLCFSGIIKPKLYLKKQTTVSLSPVGEEVVSVAERAALCDTDVEGHTRPEESQLGPPSLQCPQRNE